MTTKKGAFEEVESLLQDIGTKIEELIANGAEASGEAKVEIEKKIKELKKKKDSLENDFEKKKKEFEDKYNSKKKDVGPILEKSKNHFIDGFKDLLEAIKAVLKN